MADPQPAALDTHLYPQASAYLNGLPHGLESYATCVTSTAFMNIVWRDHAAVLQANSLPEAVRRRLTGPWPETLWLPVTTVCFTSALIRDRLCPMQPAFEELMFKINAELFDTKALRAMMHVLSPNLMILGAEMRWSKFYRGVPLKIVKAEKKAVHMRLEFPPKLLNRNYIIGMAATMKAAIAGTGVVHPTCDVGDIEDTSATLLARWL